MDTNLPLGSHTATQSDANRLNGPTCRFGPGKDKGSCTASLDLMVACVDVYTVDSEWLQVEDLNKLRLGCVF